MFKLPYFSQNHSLAAKRHTYCIQRFFILRFIPNDWWHLPTLLILLLAVVLSCHLLFLYVFINMIPSLSRLVLNCWKMHSLSVPIQMSLQICGSLVFPLALRTWNEGLFEKKVPRNPADVWLFELWKIVDKWWVH